MELTDEQKAQYMKDPKLCPSCSSSNLTSGIVDYTGKDDTMPYSQVRCKDCHASWTNFYPLTYIRGFVAGTPEPEKEYFLKYAGKPRVLVVMEEGDNEHYNGIVHSKCSWAKEGMRFKESDFRYTDDKETHIELKCPGCKRYHEEE